VADQEITTASGAGTSNSFGFTGREADGQDYSSTGRYYDSQLQRFIAEDRVEFAAGDTNLHAYVSNSVLNLTDPTGEIPVQVLPCLAGAGMPLGHQESGHPAGLVVIPGLDAVGNTEEGRPRSGTIIESPATPL
jgi:RHS repeat-associated protein